MYEVIIIVVFAFLTRIMVVRRAEIKFDTYGHLYFTKEVKQQKSGPFGGILLRVVMPCSYRQPFLLHWLIGLLPFDWIFIYQKWINACIDAVFTIALYFISIWSGMLEDQAFYVSMLYAFSPMFFSSISTGPRVYGLTPRLSSEIVANLFFIVTLLPLGMPEWGVLILGSVLASFVMLISKFGIQVLLFLAPLISLALMDYVPLLAFLIGLAISMLITKGDFTYSLITQIKHLIWYFKKNLKGEMAVSNRNSVSRLIEKDNGKTGKRYFVGLLYRLISLNSFTAVLSKLPVLVVSLFLYFFGLESIEVDSHFLVPVIIATAIYFVINLPPLLFLGEAERYLNHVAFFILASMVFIADQLSAEWLLGMIICYGVIFWLIEITIIERLMSKSISHKNQELKKVIDYIKNFETPQTLLLYPYGVGGGIFRLMLETHHRVIYPFCTTSEFSDVFTEKYEDDYPYVKLEQLDNLSDEFSVGCVVIYKKALRERVGKDWRPSDCWKKVDVGSDLFDVYLKDKENCGGIVPAIR